MTLLYDLLRPEVLISLALLALIVVRLPVKPRVSMFINAPPKRVFDVLDIHDGKIQDYGRSSVAQKLIDSAREIYHFTYTTLMHNGRVREFDAQFRVAERVAGELLVLEREGLAGKPTTNQLLRISHRLTAEGAGTRLHTEYHWGSRVMLAQLIARADLLGGIYRTKGLAETGRVNDLPYTLISTLMALLTGLMSVVAFAFYLGPIAALAMVFVLFVHELGHILAYRMIGQPWGRIMFLPFLGAIAIPRLPFEKQSQIIFAALMGPGFSVLLVLVCLGVLALDLVLPAYRLALVWLGLGTVVINAINLVPIEPLDGGVVLRSILARLTKTYARACLIALGLVFSLIGFYFDSAIIVVFGAIAIAFNFKPRIIDDGLVPLSRMQVVLSCMAFAALASVYAVLFASFVSYLQG